MLTITPPGPRPAAPASPAPPVRETLFYRPFLSIALLSTVLGGSAVGALFFFRSWFPAGPVPEGWKALHGSLQIYVLFGGAILGMALHLVPRFAGKPFSWPRPWRLLLALFAGGTALRILGDPALRGLLPPPVAWCAPAGTLLLVLGWAVFGRWVLATLRDSRGPRAPHDLFLPLGALSFVAGLLLDGAAGALAARAGGAQLDPRLVLASESLSFWGGIAGWVFGVILRAFPMFNPGVPAAGPWTRWIPRVFFPGVALLAGSAFLPAGEWRSRALGAGLVLYHLAALAAIAGAGLLRRKKGLLFKFDRTEERFYRLALAAALGGSLLSLGLAVPALGGSARGGLLPDAARHLYAIGLAGGLLFGMLYRMVPVLEIKPLRLGWIRKGVLALLAAGLLGRLLQVPGELWWPSLIRAAAASGWLVWLAFAAGAVPVFATMLLPPRKGGPALPF